MDLSTMQQKMNNGEYKSPWDFEKDMRLIINNCQEFNVGNSEILDMCSKFQQVFEERFNRIIKPRDPNELLRKEGDSFCARTSFNFDTTFPNDKNWILKELKKTQKYTMKLVEKLTEIHDIEDSIDVDKLLEDQVMTELKFRKKKRSHNSTGNIKHGVNGIFLKKLKIFRLNVLQVESKPVARNRKSVSQVNPFNQVKTVAPPEPENPEPPLPMSCSSDDEDIYEPMTEDEKYLLVRDISNLPYETLQKVIKFMKNLQPQSFCQNVNQNDLNLDVDFEKFSTKTLRKTEKFVHDIKHPKVARAVPFPRKEKLENNPKLVEELKKKLDDEQKQCESKLINLKQMLGAHFQKEMTKNAAPSEKDSSDDSSDGSSSSSSSSSSSDSGSSDSE